MFGYFYFTCQTILSKKFMTDTRSWLRNIMEFLKWLQLIVKKMKKYVRMNLTLETILVFLSPNPTLTQNWRSIKEESHTNSRCLSLQALPYNIWNLSWKSLPMSLTSNSLIQIKIRINCCSLLLRKAPLPSSELSPKILKESLFSEKSELLKRVLWKSSKSQSTPLSW